MPTFDPRKHLETEALQKLFRDWKGSAQLYNALKTGKFCSVFGTLKILYFQLRGSTRCFLLVTIFDSLLIFRPQIFLDILASWTVNLKLISKGSVKRETSLS